MAAPFLYSYLFLPDEEGKLEPDLAVEWGYDPSAFTWNIRLREGCLFHDGRPVTSLDVVYSIETFASRGMPPTHVQVSRIAPTGSHSLAIVLTQDNPDFLREIWPAEILPNPGLKNEEHSEFPIGSGPFKFSYRKGVIEVGLAANEKYYRGRPSLNGVVFSFQPDKERSWARLLSGKTDLVWGIQPQDYTIMAHCSDRFTFNTTPDPFQTVLLYNTRHPLFTDPRIRLAFAHAIDITYIRDTILRGMGVLPAGMMGFYSRFRNPELKPIRFDPEEAVRLLGETGWSYDRENRRLFKNGKAFEFTLLLFREDQLHHKIGQYLQLCLNDLGIKVHLQPVAFEELVQRYYQNNAFEALITEFKDVRANASSLLRLWCPPEGRKSETGCFDDPVLTGLMLKAVREREPETRKRLFWEVDSLITSFQPATPLCQRTSLNVLSRRFQFPHSFSNGYPRFHLWEIVPAVN